MVLPFVLALCQIAGLGSAGVAVPLIIAFWDFYTEDATALSSFIITCCTLVRIVFTWNKMDPERPQKILTNYAYASVLLPAVLAGTQVGATFLKMAPSIIIQILLFVVLVFLMYVAFSKARDV